MTIRALAHVALFTAMLVSLRAPVFAARESHLLYVAVPGVRNDVEYGGIGVLVFDEDNGFRFVRRIKTMDVAPSQQPEAVKGICACAKTARLYVSTTARLLCIDLTNDRILWNRTYEGGCDRMSITPDGRLIYLPMLEGAKWHVVDGATGDVVTTIDTGSGSHNTVVGLDGSRAYLAGLRSPSLTVVDVRTQRTLASCGPFSNVIRPFTVNGRGTLCFVNINDLLGFEVGDLTTGEKLCRVEVPNAPKGPTKRHGCPSHGIGLTPDEKEIWVDDSYNSSLHIFDSTRMPPQYLTTIKLSDQPGWITFSLDGRRAFPSTGEVIDTKTRKIIATLHDESGRHVQSEKLLEIVFANGKPLRKGDQFGIGRRR